MDDKHKGKDLNGNFDGADTGKPRFSAAGAHVLPEEMLQSYLVLHPLQANSAIVEALVPLVELVPMVAEVVAESPLQAESLPTSYFPRCNYI